MRDAILPTAKMIDPWSIMLPVVGALQGLSVREGLLVIFDLAYKIIIYSQIGTV